MTSIDRSDRDRSLAAAVPETDGSEPAPLEPAGATRGRWLSRRTWLAAIAGVLVLPIVVAAGLTFSATGSDVQTINAAAATRRVRRRHGAGVRHQGHPRRGHRGRRPRRPPLHRRRQGQGRRTSSTTPRRLPALLRRVVGRRAHDQPGEGPQDDRPRRRRPTSCSTRTRAARSRPAPASRWWSTGSASNPSQPRADWSHRCVGLPASSWEPSCWQPCPLQPTGRPLQAPAPGASALRPASSPPPARRSPSARRRACAPSSSRCGRRQTSARSRAATTRHVSRGSSARSRRTRRTRSVRCSATSTVSGHSGTSPATSRSGCSTASRSPRPRRSSRPSRPAPTSRR